MLLSLQPRTTIRDHTLLAHSALRHDEQPYLLLFLTDTNLFPRVLPHAPPFDDYDLVEDQCASH